MKDIQGIWVIYRKHRKFGSYKPKFQGSLPGYYPFEFKDYIYVILFTLSTCGVCIPIWFGLIEGGNIIVL